jgi:hypothetical protein
MEDKGIDRSHGGRAFGMQSSAAFDMVHYTVVSVSSHPVIKPWVLQLLHPLGFPAGVSSHDPAWLPFHAIPLVHQQCYEEEYE